MATTFRVATRNNETAVITVVTLVALLYQLRGANFVRKFDATNRSLATRLVNYGDRRAPMRTVDPELPLVNVGFMSPKHVSPRREAATRWLPVSLVHSVAQRVCVSHLREPRLQLTTFLALRQSGKYGAPNQPRQKEEKSRFRFASSVLAAQPRFCTPLSNQYAARQLPAGYQREMSNLSVVG